MRTTQISSEECTQVNIGKLQKIIRKQINKDYPEPSKKEIFEKTLEELKIFKINDQTFEYSSYENKFGGHRWFFLCPKCQKRALKLFLPPEGKGFKNQYQCKGCHGLKNQSLIMGQSRMYVKVLKPLKRLKEIEEKLDKGYLSHSRIDGLLKEYEAVEQAMKKTPEFRLHKFRAEMDVKRGEY